MQMIQKYEQESNKKPPISKIIVTIISFLGGKNSKPLNLTMLKELICKNLWYTNVSWYKLNCVLCIVSCTEVADGRNLNLQY